MNGSRSSCELARKRIRNFSVLLVTPGIAGPTATLHRRTAELQRETGRLHGSIDLSAIRAHQEQLKRHENSRLTIK